MHNAYVQHRYTNIISFVI